MKFSINPDVPQRLVAFELTEVEWVNGVRKPDALVGFVSDGFEEKKVLDPARGRSGKSERHFRAMLTEFTEANLTKRTKSEAGRVRHSLALRLAELGYSVNTNLKHSHGIYVVELASNPLVGDERPAVYVGQTSKDPNVRIKQHKSGTKNSKTWRLMTNRREDLEPGDDYVSHSKYNAEVLEAAWGHVLESRGYRVFGPTGFSTRKKSRTV